MLNNRFLRTTVLLSLLHHSRIASLYIAIFSITLIQLNKVSFAQVVPSSNTSTSVTVQQVNGRRVNRINGGISQGVNLFHEFSKFDVNKDNSVFFINPSLINNIIANIQSERVSKIDSLIGVDGSANLFLLNRNGFIFGPNAALNLRGSFIASTANKLTFSDGFEYFTNQRNQKINTQGQLLKLSFTPNSGKVKVLGDGHNLSFKSFPGLLRIPSILVGAGDSQNGLKIKNSRSIALIGNGIEFSGGIVTAPSGNVFINSISSGEINIDSHLNKVSFKISKFNINSDVDIIDKSLIDSSGKSSGDINIIGDNINIKNASYVLSESERNISPSEIYIQADNLLNIEGTSNPSLFFPNNIPSNTQSSIFSQNLFGKGANINIKAKEIILNKGGTVEAFALFSGETGDIHIDASGSLDISGESPLEPIQSQSILISANFTSAKGGEFIVNANNINIDNGGSIAAVSFSDKSSSSLRINVADTLSIQNFSPTTLQPSLISSLAHRDGNAGNIIVNAKNIYLQNSGVITTSTFASGSSGNLEINTSRLSIDGQDDRVNLSPFITPTGIIASASVTLPFFQFIYFLPPFPSGNAGNLSINASDIQVTNSGKIAVENQGIGNAGLAVINSNKLFVSNSSSITASTISGNGGNINIRANSFVLNNGFVNAAAMNSGLGGNIDITSETFVSFAKSSISANAINDRGGNITFNTIGFLPSPDTTITATSALGAQFNGSVTFSNPDTDLEIATTTVETEVSQPEVSSICRPTSNSFSEFIVSGEGGLPSGPGDALSENTGWHDALGGSEQANTDNAKVPDLVDAQGWVKNSDGTFSLVASTSLPITTAEISTPCNAQVQNTDSTFSNPSASLSADALSTRSHSTSANPSPALASR